MRKRKKLTIVLLEMTLLTVALCATVFSQDEPIRLETNLVNISVLVKDRNGNAVKGLARDRFEILDRGESQTIGLFSAEESPVAFGVVYDMHPATKEQSQMVLDSLSSFARSLSASDYFFLVAFNERGSLQTDFVPGIEQIEAHISQTKKPTSPNSLYDAVYLAAEKLRESKSRKRSLLIVSDSEDHRSQHSFSRLRENVRSFDIQVYAIILNRRESFYFWDWTRRGERRERRILGATDLDRAALEDLARKSGGKTQTPINETSRALGEIFQEINLEIRQQYSLSFYPGVEDGTWHKIKVRIRDSAGEKYLLNYRRGYQSPKPRKSPEK